jgi:hypothetical protein
MEAIGLARPLADVRITPESERAGPWGGPELSGSDEQMFGALYKSGMQAKATKKCVADITATDLARPNGPPPHHALAAPEDRSMSEESNKQCSICFRRYTEFGHPAEPVESGRCCNVCNDLVVIPARLRAAREATVAPPALTAVSEDHKVDIVREQDERKVAEAGREMTVSGKAPRGRKAKKAGHVPSRL